MDQLLSHVTDWVASGVVGILLGYSSKAAMDFRRRSRITKPVREFFGLDGSPVAIIHSAILDESRSAWDYPSCDTKAARLVAAVLQRAALREDIDFFILPDTGALSSDYSLLENNLVLVCGPKRNRVVAKCVEKLTKTRYRLSMDEERGGNQLYDSVRKQYLLSSRDDPLSGSAADRPRGHDFGLILSAPNPYNTNRRAVLLAGLHGAGTIGAAIAVADAEKLSELCKRRKDAIIEEVIVVQHDLENENVIELNLA